MKKLIAIIALSLAPMIASAAGAGGVHLHEAPVDLKDQASLQRGARLFVNYCLSCHSAAYQRYKRMGRDLGLSDQQVSENLMFASDKIGQKMTIAMREDDAEAWFGTAPPDLTLAARSRGPDWLYTYLLTFYEDPSRPFGVNNLVFKDVGMPHVLWKLQGRQVPVYEEHEGSDGKTVRTIEKLELAEEGTMTAQEYEDAVGDLVNFLTYVGEPVQLERKRLGVWVLLFLVLLFFVSYALKKEYWKDIH